MQNQAVKQTPTNIIIDGMPIEEYHAHHAVSNTGLGHFLRSPAHYIAFRNQPQEPTKSQELGSAIHFGVLEPKLFYQRYVRQPDTIKVRRGKAWDEFLAANQVKEILAGEDFAAVERIIEEVYSHPTASRLLTNGKSEQSIFWQDAKTGVSCRARPDYLRNDGLFIDLKTTRDASYEEFRRSVGRYGYHRQAAFGMDGLAACRANGVEAIGCVLMAIETEAPYGIGIYVLDDEAIARGREDYRYALEKFAECQKSDSWPCYPVETQTLSLPGWV